MSDYNYSDFSAGQYDLTSFKGPAAGAKAPDFLLSTLDKSHVNLLDFLGEFLVLELGSISCPLFQGRREGMEELVGRFPMVSFTVLYIREAHPGSNIPAHKRIDDKVSCARKLKNEDDENRKILIDDIEGTAHNAYGGYPNAIFIINKNGCVVFRSDWNSVPATKTALKNLIKGQPAQAKSYFLPVKPTLALKILRRSGKGACIDFFSSLPQLIWKNLIRRNFLLLLSSEKNIPPNAKC